MRDDAVRPPPAGAASPPAARQGGPAASHFPMALVDPCAAEVPTLPLPAVVPARPGAPAGRTSVAPPSFEELYAASYESLVRLGFVLTGSKELAEDLVQDCFVRLHRHYDRLDAPASYAKQAVVNACKSHFRRAGRERDRRPMLYVVEGAEGTAAHPGELHDVLLALPYRQRAAIVLRYYEAMSEVEIAEVLGCRPGTVGSLIHRGLERLRTVVER